MADCLPAFAISVAGMRKCSLGRSRYHDPMRKMNLEARVLSPCQPVDQRATAGNKQSGLRFRPKVFWSRTPRNRTPNLRKAKPDRNGSAYLDSFGFAIPAVPFFRILPGMLFFLRVPAGFQMRVSETSRNTNGLLTFLIIIGQ